jgi:hypothetical protein
MLLYEVESDVKVLYSWKGTRQMSRDEIFVATRSYVGALVTDAARIP